MKILFRLDWVSERPSARSYKQPGAWELFSEYAGRIGRFSTLELAGAGECAAEPGRRVWVCDRGPGSKVLSSEELARHLSSVLDSGTRHLEIVIGGPDGIPAPRMARLKPDLRWSFGPMTLPHELASVVAAEQLYRAWSILRDLPYHRGH